MPDYVALRRLRVQELDSSGEPIADADGRPKVRICEPGDPVPEAIHWPNIDKWVKAQRIGPPGTALPKGSATRSRPKPRRKRGGTKRKGWANAKAAMGESSSAEDGAGAENAQAPDQGAQAEG